MTALTARALWYPDVRQAAIRSERLPDLAAGWCRIETHYSAVSLGTERLIYTGDVPPALYPTMRCPYIGGSFPFPVKYGYSLVGRVTEGPDELSGRFVHVLHPHQDVCVVNSADIIPVPADVPPARATLAANLETAVNALWDAAVMAGERVVVVGFGGVGSLIVRLLARVPGVELWVTDARPEKVTLANRLGFRACAPDDLPIDADLAFHASGHPAGLPYALDSVGFEGRVVEVSWYGTREVSLQLGGRFHSERKRIIGSQVSAVPPLMAARWDWRRRRALALRLLASPEFDAHLSRSRGI